MQGVLVKSREYMASFYPPISVIKKSSISLSDGERTLLNFLSTNLDDSFEVYVKPYLNGDRPDVIVMRKGYGIMIIQVNEWEINDDRITPPRNILSPIKQVKRYRANLYDLHVDKLLASTLIEKKLYALVACTIYFHHATRSNLDKIIQSDDETSNGDIKKVDWVYMLGNDTLNQNTLDNLLDKSHLKRPSRLFSDDLYNEFKRILSPQFHHKAQGEQFNYTPQQLSLIYSEKLEQRVKGVFGSGKTTVLAARAVQAYKRALKRNAYPRILILTYNITLKRYIEEKLMRVRENFYVESFIVINYHLFIKAELNNLGIRLKPPTQGELNSEDLKLNSEDLNTHFENKYYSNKSLFEQSKDKIVLNNEELNMYFENEYYSKKSLFEKHKDEIVKYDAVLIDEIQDYKRLWMDIIKTYFRDPKGDYVLFGDVKQNIYGQPLEGKDIATNVLGVNELIKCFRSKFKVQDLALAFQREIFQDKYEIDRLEENAHDGLIKLTFEKEGRIDYRFWQGQEYTLTVYNAIQLYISHNKAGFTPNDIVILGSKLYTLKKLDFYLRYVGHTETTCIFPTIEEMCSVYLSEFFSNPTSDLPAQILRYKKPYEPSIKKGIPVSTHPLAPLLGTYLMYQEHPTDFLNLLRSECDAFGLPLELFLDPTRSYEELQNLRNTILFNAVFEKDSPKRQLNKAFRALDTNKKIHFRLNSGTAKISTIHSFKGWESEVVFLIIEPKPDQQVSFDELLYTGITRSKKRLIILNCGNQEYDAKIRHLIEATH